MKNVDTTARSAASIRQMKKFSGKGQTAHIAKPAPLSRQKSRQKK